MTDGFAGLFPTSPLGTSPLPAPVRQLTAVASATKFVPRCEGGPSTRTHGQPRLPFCVFRHYIHGAWPSNRDTCAERKTRAWRAKRRRSSQMSRCDGWKTRRRKKTRQNTRVMPRQRRRLWGSCGGHALNSGGVGSAGQLARKFLEA